MLRFNPFIRSGYRAGLSPRQCCTSILQVGSSPRAAYVGASCMLKGPQSLPSSTNHWQLHNESGNIWSHAAPALLMAALALGGHLQAWHGAAAAYWANFGSIVLCFLGSVFYHSCLAHHHHHDRLLKLDVRLGLRPVLVTSVCGHVGAGLACSSRRSGAVGGGAALLMSSLAAPHSSCKSTPSRCAACCWCWWGAATW